MKKKNFILLSICSTVCILFAFNKINDSVLQGVDVKAMDKSKDPKNDFYAFANGSWEKKNPIPPTESAWGSFSELNEKNKVLLRTIIEEAAADKKAEKGSITQKVGDYYALAMDTVRLEKEGILPIASELEKIESLKNSDAIMEEVAQLQSAGVAVLFGFYVHQDMRKSDEYISYLSQGGLGLPDRDYYLKDDEDSKKIRKEYEKHIKAMFLLAGKKNVPNASSSVMKIETELAKASMTNIELRDEEKLYNKLIFEFLPMKYTGINFGLYFATLGVKNQQTIIVTQPDFFTKVEEMLKNVSLDDWKTYLSWCLINDASDKLNSALEKQNFHFYATVLEGTKEMKPRWKRMIAATNGALGQAVGQLYVKKAFSADSKRRVNIMVDNLLAAYKERIQNLDWMGEETKKRALIKLASFSRKLGYPDKWKDYAPLEIGNESFYKNYAHAQHFEFQRMINKLGKPVDKTEWGMSPQTVNAYYNPSLNEIVFPAAIMQPPFFNPDAEDAVNYGAMGSVIGHEITHGFDDQGSKYDENGNMKNWWTEEDREKFNLRTKKLVEQFNAYKALENLNIKGELTLGENIADLGGLTIAYHAYLKSLADKKKTVIDGFSAEQRFFIGWAQAWRISYRDEALRQQILTNVHAPGNFRAVAAPSNLTEFYDAFEVKQGNKMFRAENERVKIW
jgi:putative endopeptidase